MQAYSSPPQGIRNINERKASTAGDGGFNRIKTRDVDPEILEKYDEFYKTTKSLLVLFQIMGVMPIMRTSPGHTTFRWISSAAIYAYILFAAETVYVTIVFKERMSITLQRGKRFDEYIYNIIFLSILIPHFLVPIAAWRGGPEVAKFKNMWTHFQVRYNNLTGEPLLFPKLTRITWAACILSWLLAFAIMLAQFFLQPDLKFWHTIAYYHIFATLNCLCSLWYVNCSAMGTACHGMAQGLQRAFAKANNAPQLTEYRRLWGDLSHMMQQLGKAYSNMYGLYCLVILLTTIIATYGCLSETLDHGLSEKLSGLFLIVFYCMGILYMLCNEAYHASNKVRMLFLDRLLSVNIGALDQSVRQEVEMFLTAIQKNPPVMNLNQYVNIDRKLVTTTMTSICTYLVVLMQFKMTLMRSQNKTARNAYIANLTRTNFTN